MIPTPVSTGFSRAWQVLRRKFAPQSVAAWFLAVACGFILVSAVLAMSGSLRTFAVRSLLVVTDAMPPQDEHGRTNILLLGVGDDGHDGADLTDAIILASVDPATSSVVMLSIPRDLYVTKPENAGSGRVNSLYWQYKHRALRQDKTLAETGASLAAMRALADEIGRRTGVSIQGVAKIDFSGFEQAIDAVGGIDIDVPETLVDYSYPLEEGVVGTLTIEAGPQRMDGKTALQYARSRHSTSDFDRSDRQQQILKAFARKVGGVQLLTDPAAISSLQGFLRDHFESTLATRELIGLASMGVSAGQDRIVRMNLNFGAGGDGSDSQPGGFIVTAGDSASGAILYPSSLTGDTDDWGQIRTFATLLFTRREAYLSRSRIVIDPAGAKVYQAHRLRNELVRYGFPVDELEGEPSASGTARVELSDSADRDTAALLSSLLSLPVQGVDRAGSAPRVIRVTLSKGYAFTPFQTVLDGRSK